MGYIHKSILERKCDNCGADFNTSVSFKRFCSKSCATEFHNKEISKSTLRNIPSGAVEAVSVLVMCEDLIKKGYNVYQAIYRSSNADLVIMKGNVIHKLKIRTGTYAKDKLFYPKAELGNKKLAIVTHCDKRIHYINFFP